MGQIWQQLILNPLIQSLTWLQEITGSYGLALILLAILVKLLLLPLVLWQTRANRALQALQPQLQSLQRQYQGDQVKLNQETAALYARNGVNPLTGCFLSPIIFVVNLSVWIGVYQAVTSMSGMEEGFLWLPSLALPNGWPIPSPWLAYLALPALLVVVQFLYQRKVLAANPGQPLFGGGLTHLWAWIFGLVATLLPSGLVLFWLTSSVFDLLFTARRDSPERAFKTVSQELEKAEQLHASHQASAAQQRYERVIQILAAKPGKTAEDNASLARAYYGLGQLLEDAGQEAKAIENYLKARDLGQTEVIMRLAPLMARQGK